MAIEDRMNLRLSVLKHDIDQAMQDLMTYTEDLHSCVSGGVTQCNNMISGRQYGMSWISFAKARLERVIEIEATMKALVETSKIIEGLKDKGC
jgi:hypothetical protein